jgi:methanogenic corrinoid protein MtbC1
MIFTEPVVEDLTSALIGGTTSAVDAARRCLAARLSAETVAPALLEAERTMAASVVDGRASAASTAMADRLRAAVNALAPLWEAAYAESAAAAGPAGTLAVASMLGDGHDVGRHLWRALLTSRGYDVRDLGLRAPAIVARHVATLRPDAVGIYVFDDRGQAAVQSLVAQLLRRGLQVPVLISGPGVDEAFARWVSVPEGGAHYWAGVYYCDDVPEAHQVLQQIVLYEPPPQAHTHDHGQEQLDVLDGCSSCGGCALVDSCDLPEAADA